MAKRCVLSIDKQTSFGNRNKRPTTIYCEIIANTILITMAVVGAQ